MARNLGTIGNLVGFEPMTLRASISSDTFMVPISAVIARAATAGNRSGGHERCQLPQGGNAHRIRYELGRPHFSSV